MVDDGPGLMNEQIEVQVWRARPLMTQRKAAIFGLLCAFSIGISGLIGTFTGTQAEDYKKPLVTVSVEMPRTRDPGAGSSNGARRDAPNAAASIGWTLPQSTQSRSVAMVDEPSGSASARSESTGAVVPRFWRSLADGGRRPYPVMDEATKNIIEIMEGLAQGLAVGMLIMGLALGIMKQSLAPLAMGVGSALALSSAGAVVRALYAASGG